MKLNNIVKKLKAYGFVESDYMSKMVHPKSACFFVGIHHYNECDWIKIGDRLNCASLPVSSISSFIIYHNYDGIRFEIKLTSIDGEINLCCAFD